MKVRELCSYFVRYCLAIFIFGSCFVMSPFDVEAASKATTLKELKEELAVLQRQYNNNEYKKKLTKQEIAEKNLAIANANNEIEASRQQVIILKKEIEDTKVKIDEVKIQTEELMMFYQEMTSSNAYIEFLTSSTSMTELIMRIDAVKELTDYNKDKMTEMEELIEKNEQSNVELVNKEKQLENNIVSYEQKISELDSSMLELSDISVTIEDEIKIQQSLIKMYEDAGCKDNDKLATCISYGANTGWLKPLNKAMVTSLFGYRILNGQSSYHSGIDLGVAEGTTVYSATNGKVISIIKTNCGGNQVYVQSMVNGKKYTLLYAHLLSVSVKSGQTITNQTVIGKSGGYSTSVSHGGYDKCAFGAHLHLSVSEGYYTEYPAGKAYSQFVAHLINPPGFPKKGAWFYSRTQWFS